MWMIPTFAGGFIFAFLIRLMWGKFVEDWGSIGGWMAAGVIVGTAWTLNHGYKLMYQTGDAWVDMAFAAFSGLFIASWIIDKASLSRGLLNAFMAVIGGTLGGYILYAASFHINK